MTSVTSPRALAVLALIAAATLLLPGPAAGPARTTRSRRRLDSTSRRTLVLAAGVLAAGVLLSLPPWMTLISTAGAALAARLAPARRRPADAAVLRDLAGTLDLLATCLDAGLPVGPSISAVLQALDRSVGAPTVSDRPPRVVRDRSSGGAGDRRADDAAGARAALAEVAALLALGADPDSAWRPAAAHPELAVLAAAGRRSAAGGVRLADAVREAAADLRGRCRDMAGRSAARAGVAMTAPLAVCFLPAFVCLGLAPVVIGLVSTLHIW